MLRDDHQAIAQRNMVDSALCRDDNLRIDAMIKNELRRTNSYIDNWFETLHKHLHTYSLRGSKTDFEIP